MLEHENKGTTYDKTKHDPKVKLGGKSDCSGTVSESITYAGETDPNISNSDKPNQSGVENMVDNMQKIDDNKQVEEGYAAVTHDKTHVGLVTKVNKDADGNIVSFNVTHNEIGWERKDASGKVVQRGGGKVHTDVIRIGKIGKTKAEGATRMEQKFYGLYKWDDLNTAK